MSMMERSIEAVTRAVRPRGARPVLLATALGLAACRSSAPYTAPAAVLNTGAAAAASTAQRLAGGCYATCVGGTACNPRTGFCEKPRETEPLVCQQGAAGTVVCTQATRTLPPAQGASQRPPPQVIPGVSPDTGRAPPPPGAQPPGAR